MIIRRIETQGQTAEGFIVAGGLGVLLGGLVFVPDSKE